MKSPLRIGITLGDPQGIGPEITIKALNHLQKLGKTEDWALFGLKESFQNALRLSELSVPPHSFIDTKGPLEAIRQATLAAINGEIEVIVTGPVSKKACQKEDPSFLGHTEYFAHLSKVSGATMLFVGKDLKVALATTHIPLRSVPNVLTQDLLSDTISRVLCGFKYWWNLPWPRVAVCGLNPHAGEEGILGSEEKEIITPVIQKWKDQGEAILGPWSADTILLSNRRPLYDVAISLFHDQLLPAVKLSSEHETVNVTLGLPFLRTSVDHGVAFDLFGKNIANPSSMIAAIDLAIALYQLRSKA